MAHGGQTITIKVVGDRPRTTGSGKDVKVITGVSAERSLDLLEVPLRAELACRYPTGEVILRSAHACSIELVGLKPVDELRSEIGELIGETLSEFSGEA